MKMIGINYHLTSASRKEQSCFGKVKAFVNTEIFK